MSWEEIIFIVFIFYCIFVFIDVRLVVPFYGLRKPVLPERIPEKFQEEITTLSNTCRTNKEFLTHVYQHITSRFHGSRIQLLFRWYYAFQDIFYHKKGYLPCNILNHMVYLMLIKSGRFKNSDIRMRITLIYFFIHQYLEVYVDNEWVAVDPFAAKFGVPLGKHAFLFI